MAHMQDELDEELDEERVDDYIDNVWSELPTDEDVQDRLTAAHISGFWDADGTFTIDDSHNYRPKAILTQSNAAFLRLVRHAAPFAANSFNIYRNQSPNPNPGLFSHGSDSYRLECEGGAVRSVIAALKPFLVRKAYVADLVDTWANPATPAAARTEDLLQCIHKQQKREIAEEDYQEAGAASAHAYIPLSRLTLGQAAAVYGGDGWSWEDTLRYIAGLFDGDGCVFIKDTGHGKIGGDSQLELMAKITQPGCKDLLRTIRNVLHYGKLQGGGSELYFRGADVGTFWEEVVKPYSVLKVHKYATMFKLCFNSTSSMSVSPWSPGPGPYLWGLRINCRWDEHGKQHGVNWATALNEWTGLDKPEWAQ